MEKDKILPYDKKLLPLAKRLRKKSTLSEVILWNYIKGGKVLGYKFMRQKPIDRYIVDFFCKELMLVVEVDGCTHDYKAEKDEERQKRLESLGLVFFRVSDIDVKRNLDVVLESLKDFVLEVAEMREGEVNDLCSYLKNPPHHYVVPPAQAGNRQMRISLHNRYKVFIRFCRDKKTAADRIPAQAGNRQV